MNCSIFSAFLVTGLWLLGAASPASPRDIAVLHKSHLPSLSFSFEDPHCLSPGLLHPTLIALPLALPPPMHCLHWCCSELSRMAESPRPCPALPFWAHVPKVVAYHQEARANVGPLVFCMMSVRIKNDLKESKLIKGKRKANHENLPAAVRINQIFSSGGPLSIIWPLLSFSALSSAPLILPPSTSSVGFYLKMGSHWRTLSRVTGSIFNRIALLAVWK